MDSDDVRCVEWVESVRGNAREALTARVGVRTTPPHSYPHHFDETPLIPATYFPGQPAAQQQGPHRIQLLEATAYFEDGAKTKRVG